LSGEGRYLRFLKTSDFGRNGELNLRQKKYQSTRVYFANRPTPKPSKARNEFARIQKFKAKLGKNAIYHIYTDMSSFEAAFRQHLAGVMNELLAKPKTGLK